MNKETVKLLAKEGAKTLASAGTVKVISKYVPLHPVVKFALTALISEGYSRLEKKVSNGRRHSSPMPTYRETV